MQQISSSSTTPISKMNWSDYFSFRKMITLQIVQVLYTLVAVLITIASLSLMFKTRGSYSYSSSFWAGGFLSGFLLLILGNVLWRLWCEFIIVLFRINHSLHSIEDLTRRQGQAA